jgi:cytochrome c biogenesis protein CcdA
MKKIIPPIILAVLFIGIFLFFRYTGAGQNLLWSFSDGGKLLFPLVTVAAIIDSVNPCAFSILLLTIAFLFSIGRLRSGILKVGGAYILGLFLIYILIGLGILQTLHLFNTPNFMAKLGASLLIVLGGINLINEIFPAFPIKLRIPQAAHHWMAQLMEKGSLPTAFILGGLVGLCEFPCTGGPYLMILGLLHDAASYLKGFGYLIYYNLIFILPLVIMLLIASNHSLLAKVQEWQQKKRGWMRYSSGLAMIALGVIIFLL